MPSTGPGSEPKSKQQGESKDDVLIAHMDRLWQAAAENANRLSAKGQLFAGAIIALLGFGFFGFSWLQQPPAVSVCPAWVTIATHGLLVGVIIVFGLALGRIHHRPGAPRARASDHMEIDRSDIGKPFKVVVAQKIYRAYKDLRDRNEEETLRLKRAQELFTYGIVMLLAAILLYLIGSLPSKIYPEILNADHNRTEQHHSLRGSTSRPVSLRNGG